MDSTHERLYVLGEQGLCRGCFGATGAAGRAGLLLVCSSTAVCSSKPGTSSESQDGEKPHLSERKCWEISQRKGWAWVRPRSHPWFASASRKGSEGRESADAGLALASARPFTSQQQQQQQILQVCSCSSPAPCFQGVGEQGRIYSGAVVWAGRGPGVIKPAVLPALPGAPVQLPPAPSVLKSTRTDPRGRETPGPERLQGFKAPTKLRGGVGATRAPAPRTVGARGAIA